MVQRNGSANRKTWKPETLLGTFRMGCGKTKNQRKLGEDWMEELEKKVARTNIQKEVSHKLEKRAREGHLSEIAAESVGTNRKK